MTRHGFLEPFGCPTLTRIPGPVWMGQGGHLDLQPSRESVRAQVLPDRQGAQSWEMSPRGSRLFSRPPRIRDNLPQEMTSKGPPAPHPALAPFHRKPTFPKPSSSSLGRADSPQAWRC